MGSHNHLLLRTPHLSWAAGLLYMALLLRQISLECHPLESFGDIHHAARQLKSLRKFYRKISLLSMFSCSVMFNSFATPWTQPASLLCPWDSPGKNTGVVCHFLLQRIFPTQGSNPRLMHWIALQADSLLLSHQRSSEKYWVGLKHSFRFFYNILWKYVNEFFGQTNNNQKKTHN